MFAEVEGGVVGRASGTVVGDEVGTVGDGVTVEGGGAEEGNWKIFHSESLFDVSHDMKFGVSWCAHNQEILRSSVCPILSKYKFVLF